MGGMYPPTFFGWGGDGLYKYAPPPTLFEGRITEILTFIVKKLTFVTVKLLKTPKLARDDKMYAETRSLRFCLLFS